MKIFLMLALLLGSMTVMSESKLPSGLKWETNIDDPIWSSPDAKKGGTLYSAILSFPPTMRFVGPDANSGFRDVVLENIWALTSIHPNTGKIIPMMATHWAYSADNKSVYYKLDPDAKWSDGKKVTADDYLFTLEFFRSKDIVDPWSNEFYTTYFDKIEKYDDYTIGIIGKVPMSPSRLQHYLAIAALPRHFFKLDKNFIQNYNWKICPVTGPYQVSEINKGKYVTVDRVKNWWGENKHYNKNRFNVDKIKYTVIRDNNAQWEHFKKGQLDVFALTLPEYWHKKAQGEIFDNGYAHRMWFYNDRPRSMQAMELNLDNPLLKDINIRKGLAHSLNFNKVLTTVLRNDYERLQSISTGYGDFTDKKIKARKFDLAEADKYFTKAGWVKRGPDGIRVKGSERLTIAVTYASAFHQDRLVILREEAKKAGVDLELKLMDPSAAFKSFLEKQHQVAYMAWGTDRDPQYWEHFHSKNAHKAQTNNFTNVDMPELDKLVDAYRGEFSEKKRAEIAKKIQRFVHDQALMIPTWLTSYFRQAYWGWWKFPKVPATKRSESLFDPFSTSNGGGVFWLDQDEKKRILTAKKSGQKLKPVLIKNEVYR